MTILYCSLAQSHYNFTARCDKALRSLVSRGTCMFIRQRDHCMTILIQVYLMLKKILHCMILKIMFKLTKEIHETRLNLRNDVCIL